MPSPRSIDRDRPSWHGRAGTLVAVLSGAAVLAALVLGYRLNEREGLLRLSEVAAERLELYTTSLESELGRLAFLPALLALDNELIAAFESSDAASAARVAQKLARFNARAGSQLIFAIRGDGRLLASSDPAADPAQLERMARELQPRDHGFFAAAGPEGACNYLQALALRSRGKVLGWVYVQINLSPLEATWTDLGVRATSEKLLVVDERDVVILSSVREWRYRTLTAVSEPWLATLAASAHYPPRRLQPLGLRIRADSVPGIQLVDIPRPVPAAGVYLAQERRAVPLGLRLLTLSDPQQVWRDARRAASGLAAAAAFAGLLTLYLLHRRRVLVQLTHARNQLQCARDDLEQQVRHRTLELTDANDELKRQIGQRELAENELVQAGKLAAVGQMSVGIAHEVNQPLTALRALARNTERLIDAGRLPEATSNLRAIGDTVDRMGRITSQLKSFARKAGDDGETVGLHDALSRALLLLDHRIRGQRVAVELAVPQALQVRAQATRLEQVFVNLIGNALDALEGTARPRLRVAAEPEAASGAAGAARVRVSVQDNGAGIAPGLLPRLFEPFFTTKPAGQGLGLGLVISSKLVRDFGGNLQAQPCEPGMIFSFDLEQVAATNDV